MNRSLSITRTANRRVQSGVALITALMVVALTAIAAATMASRQELDVRRTGNLLFADQAYAYSLGVETWAQLILERDAEDSENDHLGEDWATIIPPIAVEGGQITGRLEDLQGRFNLNNLLAGAGSKESALHVKQFERLLDALGLEIELAQAVLDWIDPDIETRFPDGAEDDVYLSADIPYRTANRPMESISELRLVKGFDAEKVALLLPHVVLLAPGSVINVNTATAAVLRSLADDVGEAEAETLIEARAEEGFKSTNAFLQHPSLAGREINANGLSLNSDYFLLHSEVIVGTIRTLLYSVIDRTEPEAKTTVRTRGIE